jgi:hypothetical protein
LYVVPATRHEAGAIQAAALNADADRKTFAETLPLMTDATRPYSMVPELAFT